MDLKKPINLKSFKEKVFGEVLERKETSFDYKKHGFQTAQIYNFPKGLVHAFCFCLKIQIFHLLFY